MEPRLNFERIDREGYRAMINLERHVKNCGLENSLLNLIKVRASQMNRSAFCIDVHTKNARDSGVRHPSLPSESGPLWPGLKH
jgi:AhpD family alkylhydroperoxidase